LGPILAVLCWLALSIAGMGEASAQQVGGEACPRPQPGSSIREPPELRSQNGVLELDLTVRNQVEADGTVRYCYLTPDGSQSPTLRLNPGDLLVLRLKNALPATQASAPGVSFDPCRSALMTSSSANLHFHGLAFPPLCHQDDVLMTSIQPADPPFEYRIQVPLQQPPGLYWYHAHVHGFTTAQVLGGASGALVIEGLERADRAVAGLPERVLVIRDQQLLHPDAPPSKSEPVTPKMLIDRDGDAGNSGTGYGKPAKDLSVNFVPVPYPDYPPAVVKMRPDGTELWRVVNAAAVTYLNLAVLFGRTPQRLGVVAIDGMPINHGRSQDPEVQWVDHIGVPPGARVEFIVKGPPTGVRGLLVTRAVDTGQGENDPNRPLATIVGSADAPPTPFSLPSDPQALPPPGLPWVGSVAPARVRKLYFSEVMEDPNDPNSPTTFYITEERKVRTPFDPASSVPDIVVRQGDVEDWIIENRTSELHAFHIHQLHFQVVEWSGITINEPFLRDTVNVPYFNGRTLKYPSVRLRMDFRDPNTVGTFVYHCHLLDHEDGGMIGRIRVTADPENASLGDRFGATLRQLLARLGMESRSRLTDAEDALRQSVCRALPDRRVARAATFSARNSQNHIDVTKLP
jgi:FtsP/CotA-like multicopper oxidase with cupredoxin domain